LIKKTVLAYTSKRQQIKQPKILEALKGWESNFLHYSQLNTVVDILTVNLPEFL